MKSFKNIFVLVIISLSVSSCYKNFECTCDTEPEGGVASYEYKRTFRNRVEGLCEDAENALNAGETSVVYSCRIIEK